MFLINVNMLKKKYTIYFKGKTKAWRFLAIFAASLLSGFMAIAVINYNINPLRYNTNAHSKVANYLSKGLNYEIFDPNINWRMLRREHIRQMPTNPEIIVFGGSRFQEASSKLVKNKSFYNAFIHSDYLEDMFALTKLLLDAKRLPKTLILSVRYQTFVPFEKRDSNDWLTFASEYRAMAKSLSVTTPSLFKTFSLEDWTELFSVEALKQQLELRRSVASQPGPTKEALSKEFDLIKADGSMAWSAKHQKLFTEKYALKDALNKFKRNEKKRLETDPELVVALGKLIEFLQSQGTRVVFAQTPFHPVYYSKILNTPYGEDLQRIEMEAHRLAKAHNTIAVGSFDPNKIGCPVSTFIDWHHANGDCLVKIFNAIPELGN
jgi:hypothetical protein